MKEYKTLENYSFSKESLRKILEILNADEDAVNKDDLVNWSYQYWSNWRSNDDEIFINSDEITIDIVNEIFEIESLRKQEITIDLIKKWIKALE